VAKIEELARQISDAKLRDEIAAEIRELKKQKRFGLVFEEHLPEMLRLPKAKIRLGNLVAHRDAPGSEVWRVIGINGKKAKCRQPITPGKYDQEVVKEFGLEELVLVVSFGEPIYPILTPIDRVGRGGPDKPWHILINADNYHALQMLLYAYERKVDMIYIDPPYNTGARDWKYNNDFVDRTDAWRHSKWLSMIKKRLLLARRLLTPDGVLVVTIDEHEGNNLGVLLRETFPGARVQMVTIVTNTAGSTSPGLFSRAEEYAFFVFFGNSAPSPMPTDLLAESKSLGQYWFPLFRSRGINDRPSKRPNLVYPIAIDPTTRRITGYGRSLRERVDAKEVHGNLDSWRPNPEEKLLGKPVVWPILDTGEMTTWQLSGEALLALAAEGFVRVREPRAKGPSRRWTIAYVKAGNRKLVASGAILVRGREESGALILGSGSRNTIPKSTWKVPAHDARLYGTTMLRSILGTTSFSYPKSPYAVRDTLQTILNTKRHALILDFFAGSGTTFQAAAMLNAADDGTRRVILVTNNEVEESTSTRLGKTRVRPGDAAYETAGICEAVTWPRCKYVINGKRDDGVLLEGEDLDGRSLADGFAENMEYFRLDFVDPTDVERGDAFEGILPILWLVAGAIGERESRRGTMPWYIAKHSPFAVLIQETRFRDFQKELRDRKDITTLFLVTDSDDNFGSMRRELGRRYHCVQLYKSYLENFRINTVDRHAAGHGEESE
jgi:adenine-specific DNA-methyltransferase